jgi:hypothetical protein
LKPSRQSIIILSSEDENEEKLVVLETQIKAMKNINEQNENEINFLKLEVERIRAENDVRDEAS